MDRLIRTGSNLLIGGAIAASFLSTAIYDVDGGKRAVIFDRFAGVLPDVRGEGTHLLVPWLQRAIFFDIRTKPRAISTSTGSKDMQSITLNLRVLHRPDLSCLPAIYSRLGTDYDERVLPSIGNEVLKAIVAQFDASELITQRELVSQRIREELTKRAREFHIVLEDVSITHLTFGKDFTHAVEQKQIAQQEAERAKYRVERAEHERAANVVKAEGDSEAASVISRAISQAGDALLELRKIEAAKEIAATLASNSKVSYLPGGSGFLWKAPDDSLQGELIKM